MIMDPLAPHLLVLCRAVIGIVFVLAVTMKIRDLGSFKDSVTALTGLRGGTGRALSLLVILGEAGSAILMATELLPLTYGFGIAGVVLLGFSVALIPPLVRRRRVTCSCFGNTREPISRFDLVRNAGLAGCAVTGLALAAGGSAAVPIGAGGVVLSCVMATLLVAGLVRVSDLAVLLRAPRRAAGGEQR